MATLMFSELVWKMVVLTKKNYPWPSVDSCSDYKYKKMLNNSLFKVVMHSCKLFGIYPRNHEHKRNF